MPRRLTFDAPLECTIRAAGTLDPAWAERLGDLRLRATGRGFPAIELSGPLLDQAALFGVLATLYDLGLPLLSVACRAAPGPCGAAGDVRLGTTRRSGVAAGRTAVGAPRSRAAPRTAAARPASLPAPPYR
jgi:hypothetical protein